MENTKKEVKKEIEVKEFKESHKLTKEEIAKYPTVLCRIEKIVSRKGSLYFSLSVKFEGSKGNYKLRINIDENQFNHFVRKNNLDPNKGIYVCKLPIRFIKGVGKNEKEYFSYQIFLSEKLAVSSFLKTFDRTELDDLGYKFDYELRSDVVDVELDVEW